MGLENLSEILEKYVFCNEEFGYHDESESKLEQNWCDQSSIKSVEAAAAAPASVVVGRRMKRRRTTTKNKQDTEKQRMTHIAVERNRRKQMNQYLALLRSSMPASYSQRGDQASIVGGAIDFVKDLQHLLHFLEANQQIKYSNSNSYEKPADIQVTMVESHANVKVIMSSRKQLSKIVSGFHSLALSILHLNVTTLLDHTILYSFSVKVEDNCRLTSVNEIASSVHKMVASIQEEATIIC